MASEVALILNYITQLADGSEHPSVESVLQRFTDFFDAKGIGVAYSHNPQAMIASFCRPPATLPTQFPWGTDTRLADQCASAIVPMAHRDNQGDWLIGVVWEPRSGEAVFVWMLGREWNDADRAVWSLVGHTLVRWLGQNAPSLFGQRNVCQNLEHVAQMTGRLSHEFGNYLTGILGFSELSQSQVQPETKLERYIQEVLQSARKGTEWIRRLQWFCRRNGQYSWPAELGSVLDDVEHRSRRDRAAEQQSIQWEAKVPTDLPLVGIDAASLQCALAEVTNNACEAVKWTGKVAITARVVTVTEADCRQMLGTPLPGKHVEVAVTDDGPGFSAEVRSKLFREAFISAKPRHRGLGLLMTYGILYRFHGGLRISFDEPKGACVRLYFPALSMERVAPAGAEAQVLVVHPEPFMFESLRKILEWQGHRVTIALTAQMAINAYQAPDKSFHLVLTEIGLPGLSGFDLARRILEQDPKARILFMHTQGNFHGLAEEDLQKRFPLLRWPIETAAFVGAVKTALA